MEGRVRRGVMEMAAGVLLCLIAACQPVSAASRSLSWGEGTLVTVWEQRGRALPGRAAQVWSIAYSVTDAAGTHLGVVPPTGDAAQDSSPFLAADTTGTPVLVWSRFDSVYRKIAYARFTAGAWTGFCYLTFGSGDDDLPLLGTGLTGSFLFYVAQPDRYLYAPLDLASGRLFAPPRALDVAGLGRQRLRPVLPGFPTVGGGTDTPVTFKGCGENRSCGPEEQQILQPGDQTVQGGNDVPIVVGKGNNKAFAWGLGSSPGCSRQVLIIPSADAKRALVVQFANGWARLLHRLSLPSQVEDRFGETLALAYLPAVCN